MFRVAGEKSYSARPHLQQASRRLRDPFFLLGYLLRGPRHISFICDPGPSKPFVVSIKNLAKLFHARAGRRTVYKVKIYY